MKKKIVSMLLAICMIMSITPLTAFAVEDGEDDVIRVNEVTDKILVEDLNVYKPGNYRFDFKQVGFGAYHQEGKMIIWDWD